MMKGIMADTRSIQMRSWLSRHDKPDGPANEPNQHPDPNRNSYPGEVRPMGQHTGEHECRQADCGDSKDPIKNVSEPVQHVRDASMAGGAPRHFSALARQISECEGSTMEAQSCTPTCGRYLVRVRAD